MGEVKEMINNLTVIIQVVIEVKQMNNFGFYAKKMMNNILNPSERVLIDDVVFPLWTTNGSKLTKVRSETQVKVNDFLIKYEKGSGMN